MQQLNNQVTPFSFQLFPGADTKTIRVVTIDNNPWFVAKDVCSVLGLTHVTKALLLLDDDEKGLTPIHTLGGAQQLLIISESGLYKLIMRSDKPEARAFQDWVTKTVLPAIRKDGAYIMGEEKVGAKVCYFVATATKYPHTPPRTAPREDEIQAKIMSSFLRSKNDLRESLMYEWAITESTILSFS